MYHNLINGHKCVSLKQYGEAMGLSPSRVTQLKSTLPILEFEGINQPFVDLSALELTDEVRLAAEQTLASREQLHTLTTAQLGTFFQALISRLLTQASQSAQLYKEGEELVQQLRQQVSETQLTMSNLENRLTAADRKIGEFSSDKINLQQHILELQKAATTQTEKLIEENQALKADNKGLEIALQMLRDVMNPSTQKAKTNAKKSSTAKSEK